MHMSTQRFMIEAAAAAFAVAAVFLSSIPISDAIGAVAPTASDVGMLNLSNVAVGLRHSIEWSPFTCTNLTLTRDYPPQQPTRFDILMNATQCRYGRGLGHVADTSADLDMYVFDNSVQTNHITCPRPDVLHEPMTEYSEYATALAYRPDGALRPAVYELPGHYLPQKAGWDPIAKLDISTLRDKQARVYLAAKNMTYSGDDDTLYEEDLAYLSQPEAEMIATCRDVCGLLLSAIKNQFGSFKDLCVDYYAISEQVTDSFGRTTFWFINSLSFETHPQQ